jgi:hypothetical protein
MEEGSEDIGRRRHVPRRHRHRQRVKRDSEPREAGSHREAVNLHVLRQHRPPQWVPHMDISGIADALPPPMFGVCPLRLQLLPCAPIAGSR